MRYALRVSGGVDAIALTHADRLGALSSLVTAYEGARDPSLFVHDARASDRAVDLREGNLAHQERLGAALRNVVPVHTPIDNDVPAFASMLEEHLHVRVGIVSTGPTAGDKREGNEAE